MPLDPTGYDDDFFDEDLDDDEEPEKEEEEEDASPTGSPSRLSHGGEGPASAHDSYNEGGFDGDDSYDSENEDEHSDKGKYGNDPDDDDFNNNGVGGNDYETEEEEEEEEKDYEQNARNRVTTPPHPLAGSLEEQARLAVSQLIKDVVGDEYKNDVLFEEDERDAPEPGSDSGDEYAPLKENGFFDIHDRFANDNDSESEDGLPDQRAGRGTAQKSKIRIAAWRLRGSTEGDNRAKAAGDPQSASARRRSPKHARTQEGRGGAGVNGNGDTPADKPVVESIQVGSVTMSEARAKLFGLNLDDLAKTFGARRDDKISSKGGEGAAGDEESAFGGGCTRGGGSRRGRSGRSKSPGGTSSDAGLAHLLRPLHKAEKKDRSKGFVKGFSKLSDSKHCTFKPRGKSPARRAAAKAAGFVQESGSSNGDGGNGDGGGGFRAKPATEADLELESLRSFVKRQDAFVASRRNEVKRLASEQQYECVLNKRKCPQCGNEQSLEEIEKKQKACKGERCGGALYCQAHVFDPDAFLARQAAFQKQQDAKQRKLAELFAARHLPGGQPTKQQQRASVDTSTGGVGGGVPTTTATHEEAEGVTGGKRGGRARDGPSLGDDVKRATVSTTRRATGEVDPVIRDRRTPRYLRQQQRTANNTTTRASSSKSKSSSSHNAPSQQPAWRASCANTNTNGVTGGASTGSGIGGNVGDSSSSSSTRRRRNPANITAHVASAQEREMVMHLESMIVGGGCLKGAGGGSASNSAAATTVGRGGDGGSKKEKQGLATRDLPATQSAPSHPEHAPSSRQFVQSSAEGQEGVRARRHLQQGQRTNVDNSTEKQRLKQKQEKKRQQQQSKMAAASRQRNAAASAQPAKAPNRRAASATGSRHRHAVNTLANYEDEDGGDDGDDDDGRWGGLLR